MSPSGGFRAVLFDFDGTLADLDVDWSLVRRDVAAALTARITLPEEGGLLRMIDAAETALGAAGREIVRLILAESEANAAVRPIPAGLSLLRRAQTAGPVGIVSNNLCDTVRSGLSSLGVDANSLVVVGFEDVARGKPSPEGILLALTRLDVPAQDALFIGDSKTDGEAARAAGVAFRHIGAADFEPTEKGERA